LGVSGGQQVGFGFGFDEHGTFVSHALLWTGSAASVVDLHPSGFTGSLASGVSGSQQVGVGQGFDTSLHALLWTGSAESVVDLNAFLPTGFDSAQASGIDADGNIVGFASGPASGGFPHAFLWKPTPTVVPEPSTLALFGIGLGGIAGWRRQTA
jgi:probable HAF family extracellular repeat protein